MSSNPKTMLQLAERFADSADVLRQSHDEPEGIKLTNMFAYATLMDNRLEAAASRERGLAAELDSAKARVAELEQERDGLLAFKRGVDEALNSGDGSYRP